MSLYNEHIALTSRKASLFPTFSPQLWATEFVAICQAMPVRLPGGGTRNIAIRKYVSGSNADRTKRGDILRNQLRNSGEVKKDKTALDWINTSRKRIYQCHWGHGILEEITLLCEMALKANVTSESMLQKWVDDNEIGLDCNGFTNAYYTAIGTFGAPIHYHNTYRQRARTAYTWDDINYDSAVLWARHKRKVEKFDEDGDGEFEKKVITELDSWEVTPNMNSGAHIGVVDHVHHNEIVVCQQGSDSGPRANTYKIINEAVQRNGKYRKRFAVWEIQRQGKKKENVIVTLTMPRTLAGDT